MRVLTSDRGSAALLLGAAVLALVLAATPLGPGLVALRDLPLPPAALHLTPGHLVSDGLLAVFFLLVAIELRHELVHGDLSHPRAAAVPAAAALGGVAVPAALYLLVAGRDAPAGWPIPTATDIAFALGLLALLGRGLPGRVRAFLLGLAILDDLVAILLIAVVLPVRIEPVWLLPALLLLGAFALGARRLPERPRGLRVAVLVLLGVAVWVCTALSGVHATLAGVALGLLLPAGAAARAERALQPVTRGAILPLFAFSAALIPPGDLAAAVADATFWGVALALPLGKPIGIAAATAIAQALLRPPAASRLRAGEVLVVGLVAGVGFTVSLLMAGLAFREGSAAAVLGVLAGSAAAIVLSAAVVPVVAARARR